MAAPQPKTTLNQAIDPKETQKALENLLIIQTNVLQETDATRQVFDRLKTSLGKVFQNIVTNSSDINHFTKKNLELMDGQDKLWKNRGRLIKAQKDAETSLFKIRSQYSQLHSKLQGEEETDYKNYSKTKEEILKNEATLLKKNAELAELERNTPLGTSTQITDLREEINNLDKVTVDLIEANHELEKSSRDQNILKLSLLETQERELTTAIEISKSYTEQYFTVKNMAGLMQALDKAIPVRNLISMGLAGVTLASAIGQVKEYFFRLDGYSTSFAKNTGISKDFAEQLTHQYQASATSAAILNDNLNKTLLTTKAQAESQQQLQAATGQLSLYTAQNVQDNIYLTKQLDLQAEEAARITQLGLLSGKSTQQETNDVFEQVAGLNQQLGLRLSGRDVLKEVAKIGGVVSANYGNDVVKLAKAVAQSKALGVSIQEAATASRSLLEFESSIENELEASLLTGRQWNLDKARSLALSGDSAGALEEELKNVGKLADFQKLNVVAKEAEAKAVGMTVDQLSDALRQQEVLRTSTDETRKAQEEILKNIKGSTSEARFRAELNSVNNGVELQAMENKVSKQLEYEQSMERVGDALKSLVTGPLKMMIEGFVSMTTNARGLNVILGTAMGYLTGMVAKQAALVALEIAGDAATGMWANAAIAASIAGPLLGSILGAGIGASLPTTNVQDALIGPKGDMILQTPEGNLIKPSKNDSVLFAPNAGDAAGRQGGSADTSRMESLLSSILNSVSKPGAVYMDSTRVGTSMAQAYSVYA